MMYTLYDTRSGNRIGAYDTKAAAYDAVMREVEANDDADELALEESDGEHFTSVGEGRSLFDEARAETHVAWGEVTTN